MKRLVTRLFCAFLLLTLPHLPASAAVEIAFYSRELGGSHFPHAFVTLRGKLDSTGRRVETSFGFTAKSISPAILFQPVPGEVIVERRRQIAQSERQFSLILTDAQVGAVLQIVSRWRHRAQPSYDLHRRNCIHFVGEIAEAIGLRVTYPDELMKRPRAFLAAVRTLNPHLARPVR